MRGSILGTEVRRVEDPELLTGHGSFVGNAVPAGTLHAVFVRSPMAAADVTGVETEQAAAAAGVRAVLTGADTGPRPVPAFARASKHVGRPALATDRVRYVGEPVALVVADTLAAARDAAELVDVDYEPRDPVVDPVAAVSAGAPLVHDELPGNLAGGRRDVDPGPDGLDPFAGAAHLVRLRMVNQRVACAPIEPHGLLAEPDDGGLRAQLSTQHPHLARTLLAEATGLEESRVRVVAPHVGGAFGGKPGIVAEHAAVALAALRLGRPVLWQETRSEAMLSMHGRGQVQWAELGLDADGRFLALRARVLGDCGAYGGFGGSLAYGNTYAMAQGPYAIPVVVHAGAAVVTNTTPVGAFRGAGRPEAAALLERLVDAAAREVGLPPEELRRRNFLPPDGFPHRTRTGLTYDSGDYAAALEEALRLAEVDRWRTEQKRRRASGDPKLLGIGLASYVEITGFGGTEAGSVTVHPDATATVRAGTSAHGQGHGTTYAMLVSEHTGIPVRRIRLAHTDTGEVRRGGGTGGSRSLQMGGGAVDRAAAELRERAVALAARLLETDPGDVEVIEDGFAVRGVPGSALSWPELAAWAHAHEDGLAVDTDFTQDGATFPSGTHVAVVEVDPETGRVVPLRLVAVDDCGRVLNPVVVTGQQHGGALQGVSQALWEEMVYDAEGQPVTSSFADYPMPTAADAIRWTTANPETPTPLNPLGVKGIGESATVGATPAVQNAVVDALAHLGVRHVDLPCTPQRVWAAVRDARAGTLSEPWDEPPEVFRALRERRPRRDEAAETSGAEAI